MDLGFTNGAYLRQHGPPLPRRFGNATVPIRDRENGIAMLLKMLANAGPIGRTESPRHRVAYVVLQGGAEPLVCMCTVRH